MPVSARLCTRVGPCLYRCVCGHLYLHVGLHRGFQNREHRGSRSPIAGPEALGWAGLGPAGPSSAPWTEALLHTPAAGVLASLAQWVSPSGAAPMALSARPVSAPPCILGVQRSEGSAGWPWGAEAACRAPSEETACPPPPPAHAAVNCGSDAASTRGWGCLRPRAAGASRKGTTVTRVTGQAAGARHAVSPEAQNVRQEGQGLAGVQGTARAVTGSRLHKTRTGSGSWGTHHPSQEVLGLQGQG